MQEKQNNIGLIWFRNNLRTKDNASLKKAVESCDKVIAVYFFDPKYFKIDPFGFQKVICLRNERYANHNFKSKSMIFVFDFDQI